MRWRFEADVTPGPESHGYANDGKFICRQPSRCFIRLLFFSERKRSVMVWKGQADEPFDRFCNSVKLKLSSFSERIAQRADTKVTIHLNTPSGWKKNRTKQNEGLWNQIISWRQQTSDNIRLTAGALNAAFTSRRNYCNYQILFTCLDTDVISYYGIRDCKYMNLCLDSFAKCWKTKKRLQAKLPAI